jgi:alpha-beta hydrolase superfamily lysophospholipase
MKLNIKMWETPTNIKEKGVIFIIHGMGEYYKRYENVGAYLSNRGYSIAMIDHRGHGTNINSLDELGLVKNNFKDSIEEIQLAIEEVRIKKQGIPLYILGHSMGSFIAQIVLENGVQNNGVILSGSVRPFKFTIKLAYLLANLLLKFGNKRSYLFNKLVFGLNNIKFKGDSKFRWLTRDEQSVEEFDNDLLCGSIPYTSYFKGLFYMIGKTIEIGGKKKNIQIPMYIFSGGDDPVGEYGIGTKRLYKFYKQLGYKDIELKIYPKGRHEMLSEINKERVYLDLIDWLDRRT